MILSNIINQIDSFYPKNLKFNEEYKESTEHQNFLNTLYSTVHNQYSEENAKFLELTESLNSSFSNPFRITTNNQFPAFFCSSLIEQLEKSKSVESHRYLSIGISLLTNSFCIHDYIVNTTFFNNKRFPNKVLQIVHSQEDHSDFVAICIKLMKSLYNEYQFYNHYFLACLVPEYNPPFDLKNHPTTLYHLLFGSDPNFQYSIPYSQK